MAQSISLMGATYNDVPAVLLPKSTSGMAQFDDTTDANATAGDIASGKTAYVNGVKLTGTGSGGGGLEEKDVNFFDYDGTLLYSYTAVEAQALSALPSNPSHTGLTAQGWNYTLAQMKAQVTAMGACDVGQMYTTSDGKTRLYITIGEGTSPSITPFYVRITPTKSTGVTIDWGDGTTTTTDSTNTKNYTHTYNATGNYLVTLTATNGTFKAVGTSAYSIYGQNTYYYNRCRIRKIEIGNNFTEIGNYAFRYCYNLESITIPNTVTTIGTTYCFGDCSLLKHITLPNSVSSAGTMTNCFSLRSISIPTSVTTTPNYFLNSCNDVERIVLPSTIRNVGTSSFSSCRMLKSLNLPSGITTVGASAFSDMYRLQSIVIPSELTASAAGMFNSCYSLSSVSGGNKLTSIPSTMFHMCESIGTITIPSTVTTIGAQAFANCLSLREIHFKPVTPPTVANGNAWSNLPTSCIIYVPSGKLTAYTTADNYPDSNTYTYVEEST